MLRSAFLTAYSLLASLFKIKFYLRFSDFFCLHSGMESPECMVMTKYTLLRGVGLMLVVGAIAGCATAPMQEMSDARQAVQAAREAGAAVHSKFVMDSAERDLSQAELKLRGRYYTSARDEAVAAKQEAVKARNMALAISQAKEAVAEAERLGALTQKTRDSLAKAEAASAKGSEEEVVRAAQQAKQQAQDDIRRFRDAQ